MLSDDAGSGPTPEADTRAEMGDDAAVTQVLGETSVTTRTRAVGERSHLFPDALIARAFDVTPRPGVVTRQIRAVTAPRATRSGPTLLSVIGSVVFGVFDFVSKIIEGPPVVPPGSTATVGRSRLTIDCGDGYTTEADWYFPSDPDPSRLIYFQHGFAARAGFYNATAAHLAEENHAIVVAPSITSNFLACDGCNLLGEQMHAGVARLFLDDQDELLASAQAAGFTGTALPQRFVIAGHSGGGTLAEGAAGYFEQFAPDDQTRHNLVGVLLYETSNADGILTRALAKIPTDIPVLHIAAKPSALDLYGDANEALEAARPGQFNGVQLVGGVHGDAFQSSRPFIQFAVSVLFGFSKPENKQAVQILSEGWINDMYAGTVYDPQRRTGSYGDPGTTIDITTTAGTARADVLPAPIAPLSPLARVLSTVLHNFATLDFATCATPPVGPDGTDTSASAQMVTASCMRSTSAS